MRLLQEFYCHECKGFFLVNLNMGLNHVVEVVCPKCQHKHKRSIKDGQIFEFGRDNSSIVEEIVVPMAHYSATPHTQEMLKARQKGAPRDGILLDRDSFLMERWVEAAHNQSQGGDS